MSKIDRITYAVILTGFGMSILFYPYLPYTITTHWNVYDQPDRFLPKGAWLFMIPIVSILLYYLFHFIPQLDPLHQNQKHLKKYYEEFLLALVIFFFYIHFSMIIWNSGIRFKIGQLLGPLFGVLLYQVGTMMIQSPKYNHIAGILTPWVAKKNSIWQKTHRFAGGLFRLSAAIACFSFAFPELTLYFILAPLLLSVVYIYFYSYLEFRQS